MKTIVHNLALALALLAALPAFARTVEVPYQHLGDYVSAPGETEVTFLKRIAPLMHTYSMRHEVETCAAVGRYGDTYAVVLGTNLSHVGCVIDHAKLLPGYAFVEGIHSHVPDDRTYLLSAADAKLAGVRIPLDPVRIRIDSTSHFSRFDFDAPGYLAVEGGLLHEDGRPGTETEVK